MIILQILQRWFSDSFIPSWTPSRVKAYEKETLRMLGRGETAYDWPKLYRPSKVVKFEKRKAG